MMPLFHHQRYVDVSNISSDTTITRTAPVVGIQVNNTYLFIVHDIQECYYIAARSATAICYRTDHGYDILKHCIIKVEIKRCDATRCTACVTFYMIKYEG
ncbi:hypothetical protein T05_7293 [Trichinella murrelli]|uniref:Uncharacterized protein n=1 Tax=Trichinella murrelli TaxID=144512 RepID=A0A0V0TP13_9BILA|nr:hypothetical protein T05_7293 [Trichinella murrelli]